MSHFNKIWSGGSLIKPERVEVGEPVYRKELWRGRILPHNERYTMNGYIELRGYQARMADDLR